MEQITQMHIPFKISNINLQLLHKMALQMHYCQDLNALLELISNFLIEFAENELCCIYLKDNNDLFKLKFARGLTDVEFEEMKSRFNNVNNHVKPGFMDIPIRNQENLLGYITVKLNPVEEQSLDVKMMIEFLSNTVAVAINNFLRIENIEKQNVELIKLLGSTIEFRDKRFHGHLEQVSMYARLLAQKMQLSADEVKNIEMAAYLHDIGLLKASDEFHNNKNPRIEDYIFLRTLVVEGTDFLKRANSMKQIVTIIQHITEEYDGSGYPEGLAGEQIPIGSRIISLVSDLDGLQRFYGLNGPVEALQKIKDCGAKRFDPQLISYLEEIIYSKASISRQNSQNLNEEGVNGNINKGLTTREVEILTLIAKGDNNKEISEKLYISEKTVKTHITSILKKLSVTDRTKAAVMAIQSGISPK